MAKDRSAHEASRGKKASLAALSREMPAIADIDQFLKTLISEQDRSAAIMASSFTERGLELAIRSKLADPGEVITRSWFEGMGAPFGTFSAKIGLGEALAIFGPKMAFRLNAIREIRNAFAHSIMPIDFGHSTIKDACKRMAPFMEGAKR